MIEILLDQYGRFVASLFSSALNKITESFTKEIEYFFEVDKKHVEKPTVIILINKNYFEIVEASTLFLYIAAFR